MPEVLPLRARLHRHLACYHVLRPCLPHPRHIREEQVCSLWYGQPLRRADRRDCHLLRLLPMCVVLLCLIVDSLVNTFAFSNAS